MARESVFLLGPPGVAKSLIARRLKFLFRPEANAFEYLMNRFSTPDEIFGPVPIAALRKDRLERMTRSYLPEAKAVFLDEIWKAGPSIQNTLLAAINERIFRNGGVEQKIPMRVLISASNELPAEGEGLEALWDRFLVRLEVNNIERVENRHRLIQDNVEMEHLEVPKKLRFSDAELADFDREVDRVSIPESVLLIVDEIIARIQARRPSERVKGSEDRPGIYVSDRRWRKISRLLRTSALCNGRQTVNETDCYLISYCIWDHPSQIAEVRTLVLEAIEKSLAMGGADIMEIQRDWQSLKARADNLPSLRYTAPTPYDGHYKIDLSKNASVLTDVDGNAYPRLPIASYESLSSEFQEIRLTGTARSKPASVHAKKGAHPAQVILEKSDQAAPLAAFPAVAFSLTSMNQSREGTRSVLDLSGEAGKTFLQAFEQFRKRLDADNGTLSSTNRTEGDDRHLFVELAADVHARLGNVQRNASELLGNLRTEIARFAKERLNQ